MIKTESDKKNQQILNPGGNSVEQDNCMVSKWLPTDCFLVARKEKSELYSGEGGKHRDWVIKLTSPMRDRWPLWPPECPGNTPGPGGVPASNAQNSWNLTPRKHQVQIESSINTKGKMLMLLKTK